MWCGVEWLGLMWCGAGTVKKPEVLVIVAVVVAVDLLEAVVVVAVEEGMMGCGVWWRVGWSGVVWGGFVWCGVSGVRGLCGVTWEGVEARMRARVVVVRVWRVVEWRGGHVEQTGNACRCSSRGCSMFTGGGCCSCCRAWHDGA